MAAIPALDQLEPRQLRWVFVALTLVYPLGHLVAPSGATDPWIVWWLVGTSFSLVALISRWVPAVERSLLTWFHLCSGLVTLQLFLLAFWNDMHPFYAMGSTMAVLATLPFYRLALQLSSKRVSREHQELLEQKVRERTDELSRANQRLRAEMKQREWLEQEPSFSHELEALGRLAGGVAHDFNNLLTAIGIYADLLLKSMAEGDPLRADVAQIQKAGRQASTLIQHLLTFARRRDVETKLLDVGEVIGTARSMLEHLLGEDVELVCRLDAAPRTIRANPDQLEQVLVNLALNARDAMPDGGVFTVESRFVGAQELRSLGLDAKADAYVLLAAADTGVGMDRETRARVFDPFFTRKQVGQGTGLGLAMVYGVVTHAGGCVRVLSEPGRGARFELYWPLESEAPLHAGPAESRQAAPGAGG